MLSGQKKDAYFFCYDSQMSGASPDKRRKYDEAYKAAALRLASESRSTQAAAHELGISPKLLYRWQQAQLLAEAGSVEVARGPEVRQLRPQLKRAEQELDILKRGQWVNLRRFRNYVGRW